MDDDKNEWKPIDEIYESDRPADCKCEPFDIENVTIMITECE